METGGMKIRDLMSRGIIAISPESTVSEARAKMLSHGVHQLPILERGKLVGIITYKHIIERGVPLGAKVRGCCSSVQSLAPDSSVALAARRMLELDVKALPVVERDRVIGMISSSDIIPLIGKSRVSEKVESIMTQPITIKRGEGIGKARALMRENDISLLPVVNNDGTLYGSIGFFDLLKALQPVEKVGRGEAMGDFISVAHSDAVSISSPALVVKKEESISSVARIMGAHGASSVVIEEGRRPIGIVAQRDMLEMIASTKSKGVYVQLTNLGSVDDFAREKIDDIVTETVRKIAPIVEPQAMFLHVKKHEKGGRTKYSVRVRLQTARRTFSSKAWGWKILQVVTEAMRQIEHSLIQKKERSLAKRRGA